MKRAHVRYHLAVWTGAMLLAAAPALADVEVRFIEGAPKDRFVIRNAGACDLERAEIVIDLSGSVGALVFDTTPTGAGVEVFQPFEMVEGANALNGLPEVGDGDMAIAMSVARLGAGGTIAFTIDVDDTLGSRAITVTDGEISGAEVRAIVERTTSRGAFDGASVARVPLDACSK